MTQFSERDADPSTFFQDRVAGGDETSAAVSGVSPTDRLMGDSTQTRAARANRVEIRKLEGADYGEMATRFEDITGGKWTRKVTDDGGVVMTGTNAEGHTVKLRSAGATSEGAPTIDIIRGEEGEKEETTKVRGEIEE